LETGLTGGVEKRDIKIAEYDPKWLALFEKHANIIADAIAGAACRIEHIGSTSVPGLAAKPIIDFLVVVKNSGDESVYLRQLEAVGGIGMERGQVSRKYFFLVLASVFMLVASVAVFILCFAMDQRYLSKGAVIAVGWAGMAVAVFLPFFVAIFAPALARKSSAPANYPRIEHLRIAGKYAPTGAAKIGVSPLNLR
jgi:GrpB protein